MILALDADSATLFATVILKDLAPGVPVIARVNEAENVERIHRAGADFALSISQVSGQMLAKKLLGQESVAVDPQLKILKIVRRTASPAATPPTLAIRERTGCSWSRSSGGTTSWSSSPPTSASSRTTPSTSAAAATRCGGSGRCSGGGEVCGPSASPPEASGGIPEAPIVPNTLTESLRKLPFPLCKLPSSAGSFRRRSVSSHCARYPYGVTPEAPIPSP